MFSDYGNDGPGENPLVGRAVGIVVINGAAGGIPSVDGVARRAVCGISDRLVELPVVDGR